MEYTNQTSNKQLYETEFQKAYDKCRQGHVNVQLPSGRYTTKKEIKAVAKVEIVTVDCERVLEIGNNKLSGRMAGPSAEARVIATPSNINAKGGVFAATVGGKAETKIGPFKARGNVEANVGVGANGNLGFIFREHEVCFGGGVGASMIFGGKVGAEFCVGK